MNYSFSHPALNGETVTEGHARFCRDNGHAKHIVDGTEMPFCPRCGEHTGTVTTTVRIKTNVPGMVKSLKAYGDKGGWHVLFADANVMAGYFPQTMKEINAAMTSKGYTLIQVMGNILAYSKEDGSFGSRLYK